MQGPNLFSSLGSYSGTCTAECRQGSSSALSSVTMDDIEIQVNTIHTDIIAAYHNQSVVLYCIVCKCYLYLGVKDSHLPFCDFENSYHIKQVEGVVHVPYYFLQAHKSDLYITLKRLEGSPRAVHFHFVYVIGFISLSQLPVS